MRWGGGGRGPRNTRGRRARGQRHRPGRRLARRVHRPARRRAGADLDWYEAGEVELTLRTPRACLPRVRAVRRTTSRRADIRCQVIGRPLFDIANGWGGLPRRRAGLRGHAPGRRRSGRRSYPDAPYTFVPSGVEDGDTSGRASTPMTGRWGSARARSAGRRKGRPGRRAGGRPRAGVPRAGARGSSARHRRARPRRPPCRDPGRAGAAPALPAAPLRRLLARQPSRNLRPLDSGSDHSRRRRARRPPALGGRRPAARRRDGAHPADPARRRRPARRLLQPGVGPVEVLPLLLRDAAPLRARRRPVHPGRPRDAGGVRDAAVGADDRARQLRGPRPEAPPGERSRSPRSPSWSRTPSRAAGSASCCSSTSPRPAGSGGSSGSWPRCCPTTTG